MERLHPFKPRVDARLERHSLRRNWVLSGPAQASPGGAGHLKAKSVQTKPSQTKPDQINPSKIAWFCLLVLFVRIETFQCLTANPNKNSRPHSGTRPDCKAMELTRPPLIGTVAGLSAIEYVITENSSPSFCSTQENVGKCWNCPCSPRPLLAPNAVVQSRRQGRRPV